MKYKFTVTKRKKKQIWSLYWWGLEYADCIPSRVERAPPKKGILRMFPAQKGYPA